MGWLIALVVVLVLLFLWYRKKNADEEAARMAAINLKFPKRCDAKSPCPKGQACQCPAGTKKPGSTDVNDCPKSGLRCVSTGDIQSAKIA